MGQQAGDYPNKPIRFIIPQTPGAASDVLARILAPRLGDALGQPIVVDNRAGAGVSAVHVPHKGAGQSVVAVIAGEAQWTFTPMQGPLPHVRAGKLRALAVGGATRSAILPDVPTAAEGGLPDYYSASWYGIMVPKGTPSPVIDKLNAAMHAALASQEFKDQIVFQGAEPKASTPAEFGRLVQDEFTRAGKVVKLAGVKVE